MSLHASDPIQGFRDHMRAVGCDMAQGEIIADDKPHRYRVAGDKPKTMNGSYKLKIEPDGFAVGWCMTFKEGVTHPWHVKATRKYTEAERAAWKSKAAAAKAAREAEEAQQHKDAAERARGLWRRADAIGEAGYLTRKGMTQLYGARVMRGLVVVPCWGKDGLASLQFIAADGAKRFLRGGQMEGAYHAIKGDDTLVICEGFATGAKIHAATGHSVICAFNAGNLKAVAVLMRKKYPDRKIIIGADNDQWTAKPDGKPYNPGIEGAQQAAVAIGGAVVIAPQVAVDDPKRRTDWDDIHDTDGPEAVREAFAAALRPVPEPEPDTWEPDYSAQYDDEPQEVSLDPFDEVRPLGHDDGVFFFFPRVSGQVVEMSATALGSMLNLCRLANRSFWDRHFGGADISEKKLTSLAGTALIEACQAKGIHDRGRVRGVGAWLDGNRPVYNCGDAVVWDGGRCSPPDYRSGHVYISGPRLANMDAEPLTNPEAAKLLEICRKLTWKSPQHGYILAGWIVLSMVGGALRWRPHIVVTGEKGAGKSFVLDSAVKPVLGATVLDLAGGTSEPGIRKNIGASSRPVVMDEAESETQRDKARMEEVMMLARKASSGATIANFDGSYTVRSSFCFAAINPRIVQGADLDRNTIIELMRDRRPDAADRFTELKAMVSETLTPEFSARLLARTFWNIGALMQNVETFATVMAGTSGGQRFGDQFGFLIAGAYSLTSTAPVSMADARAWCAKQDWSWAREDNDMSDSERLLSVMLAARARYDDRGMSREASIGRLIDRAINADGGDRDAAISALGEYGIHADHDRIVVANACPQLSGLLKDTTWGAGWRRALLGLDGAEAVDKIRFTATLRTRGVAVPMRLILGEITQVDEELPFESGPEDWR